MPDDRQSQLQQLADQLENLTESPLYTYRRENGYHPVIGEGNPHARLMFIGEAPGKTEAKTGRPFVGAAGRVLDELLHSIGLDRSTVYITNIVKDRPPDNRDPTPEEIELYASLLDQQIEIIQPAVIVTLGRFAMSFILERFNRNEYEQKISDLHGQVFKALAPYGEIAIVPLYHPAVTLYNSGQKDTLREDFQILAQLV